LTYNVFCNTMYYMNNKDYIINLRVSRATYDKIKRKAQENKESISSLIRKTVDDSIEIISDLSGEIFGKNMEKGEKFRDIISYHKVKTAQRMKCDKCDKLINIGETATIGETSGIRKYFFCSNCK
jgi:hypothetical protein